MSGKTSDTQLGLERAIHAANTELVLSILRALDPGERADLRPFVLRLGKLAKDSGDLDKRAIDAWGKPATAEQHDAALAAVIVCGTAEDVARVFRHSPFTLWAVVREFRPPSTHGLGDALMQVSPHHLSVVQQMVVEGLIERPVSEAYLLAVIGCPRRKSGVAYSLGIGDWLERDPGFLNVVLRVLDIEGRDRLNLAAVDRECGKDDVPWSKWLCDHVEAGALPRAVVHDKVLSALSSGWAPFRAQWFSAFHDLLGVTVAEMAPHAPRYLALVASNSPATVSFALDAVKTIDDARPFDARVLLDAAGPALSSSARTHVEAALRLVDAAVARDATLGGEAAARIVVALAHKSADVQGKVLKRLAAWPANDAVRAALAQSAGTVAAVHRTSVARLAAPAEPREPAARPAPAPRVASTLLDPEEGVAPVTTGSELAECVAYFLANEADIDEFERALAGLMRLAPFDNATRALLEPLAIVAPDTWVPSVSGALRFFLQFLLTGRAVRTPWGQGAYPFNNVAHQQLCLRLDELMEFFHRHPRCVPLSTPTHARGFIAPAVLVERLAAYRTRGASPGPWDAMLAILRLAPVASPAALAAARALGQDTLAHAVRFALGEDVAVAEPELARAAARIRAQCVPGAPRFSYSYRVVDNFDCPGLMYDIEITPPADTLVCDPLPPDESSRLFPQATHRPPVYADFAGFEAPCIHYFASMLPADPEGFFASCVLARLNRRHELYREAITRSYLLPLLHTNSPGPMARLLIASALAAPESSHVKLAGDALLRMRGQFDEKPLMNDVRTLVGAQLISAGRLVKALQGLYAQEPQAAPLLMELLGAILAAAPDARLPVAPRDIAAALETLVEIVLARELSVPPHLCAVLSAMKLGAKSAALRKQLLARAAPAS